MVALAGRQFLYYFHRPLSHCKIMKNSYQHRININIDISGEGTKNEMAIHKNNKLTSYFKTNACIHNKVSFPFLQQLRSLMAILEIANKLKTELPLGIQRDCVIYRRLKINQFLFYFDVLYHRHRTNNPI